MAQVVPEQADEFKKQVDEIVDNTLLQEEMMTSLAENLIQKGRTEGREERQYIVAERMLRKGYSIDEIVEIAELPREEVERLSFESQDSSD